MSEASSPRKGTNHDCLSRSAPLARMPLFRRRDSFEDPSEAKGWFGRRKAQPALTAWDLISRVRSAEEALQMPPSRAEVQAMVLAFEQTASRLETMGEGEKASDLLQIFLPSFLAKEEVSPCLTYTQRTSHVDHTVSQLASPADSFTRPEPLPHPQPRPLTQPQPQLCEHK